MTVLEKRSRNGEGSMVTGPGMDGKVEKRHRSAALDTALAVELGAVKEHGRGFGISRRFGSGWDLILH